MSNKITEELWIKLYVEVDDLKKNYENYCLSRTFGTKIRQKTRHTDLNESEIATIQVMYQLSGYKCFKYYYESEILGTWRNYFPLAPSYDRFTAIADTGLGLLVLWCSNNCSQSLLTGYYIVDSKRLEVCHIKREHQHKVFEGFAQKGKSSMGWFLGFKVHLVINHLGQIVQVKITPGNVADNNKLLLQSLLKNLRGKCVGDKGYQTTLFEQFYNDGLHLLVKPKKNMKKVPLTLNDGILLRKRGVIESVNDILDNHLNIEHSRHRKPLNAFCSIISAIIAYQYLDTKPHIYIKGAINYLNSTNLKVA